MRAALLLLLLLLLAPLARGADALAEGRLRVQQNQESASALRQQQLELSRRIGELSQEIATLKGAKGRASAARLDAALKENQALSTTLGDVTRSLTGTERTLTEARTSLLTELGNALVQLRGRHDRTQGRSERARLLEEMRSLRNESARIRTQLPPALMPTLPAEIVRGDDPEDLLAQADVLRDNQDRLTKRLAELRIRLKQARAEADLARRVDDFMGEASLFDEQDRRHPQSRTPQFMNAGAPTSGDPSLPTTPTTPPPSRPEMQLQSLGRGSGFDLSSLSGRAGELASGLDGDAGLAQLEQLEAQLLARAREYAERAAALELRARGQ